MPKRKLDYYTDGRGRVITDTAGRPMAIPNRELLFAGTRMRLLEEQNHPEPADGAEQDRPSTPDA